jgi:hypothetical protein
MFTIVGGIAAKTAEEPLQRKILFLRSGNVGLGIGCGKFGHKRRSRRGRSLKPSEYLFICIRDMRMTPKQKCRRPWSQCRSPTISAQMYSRYGEIRLMGEYVMRLFVRGVLIGLVTAAPNGFHLDIKKFARYLVASVEEVGETLHDLEAEGILQYEQEDEAVSVWASSYTEENIEHRVGFRRDPSTEEG